MGFTLTQIDLDVVFGVQWNPDPTKEAIMGETMFPLNHDDGRIWQNLG